MLISKVWFTEHGSDLVMLSMAVADPTGIGPDAESRTFPVNPTPEHPLRKTIIVGLLDTEDLLLLKEAIDKELYGG